MLAIAVTGGLGAGKTTVTRLLAERGCCVIDADRIGHEVLLPGGAAYASVVALFGGEILDGDRNIDRRQLAAKVFADPQELKRLEAASHPPIRQRILQELEESEARGCAVTVIDVPLLERGGLKGAVDLVIVVDASDQARTARETARGRDPEDVRRRMAAQPGRQELREAADYVIENDGDLAELQKKTGDLWETKILPRALVFRL